MKDAKKVASEVASAAKKARKLGFGQSSHVLVVCMDRKTGKCCRGDAMADAWKHLKTRCRELRKSGREPVIRVKAECLDICKAGPIIGVLPDDIWYGHCTPAVIDRIIDEHLSAGNVVEEYVIASKPSAAER
ncbi:(2Fe-2S) ferredoxin domain-containing protein [Roseiconus lacunae]|uniref:Ferredoxin n=1 Tax=Roseiconus lacunae TaxID=2605694 RepID=A0ABT7PDA8_9BACT|nr:(2Fe-2S) ferredoxin domain-containing protein [Roseiconus lacunae]MDM4014480.1 ferredoxin [Roseiconus lacunae]